MKVSKKTARRYLLAKHFLLPPKSLSGIKGIDTVFKSLHSIQFDPQNPCGNNVDLVLQSRVKNIHPLDYHRWLYRQRKGIECLDKELCLVPIEDFCLCRRVYSNQRTDRFIEENKKKLEKLVKKISENGELSSSRINNPKKVDCFWGNPRWGKAALDVLWRTGRLVISKREKGRKYFDLPDKLYGAKFNWPDGYLPDEERVIRRVESVGILPKTGTGQGWLGMGKGQQIAPIVDELLKKGILKELSIDGVNKKYLISSVEKHFFQEIKKMKTIAEFSFLAPLDNLLWDRNTIRDLFDFDYKWEVYTPKVQRRYGHYTLPVLYGDRFVARIEPRLVGEILEIKGLWLEPSFFWDKKSLAAFYDCLNRFCRYLKNSSVNWLCDKPD